MYRPPPPSVFPGRAPYGLALAALVLLGAGCGEEPPALTVGPVAFSQEELLGFTESREASLARVTAFGLAVADSATLELGAPVVGRWMEDRLLEIWAAERVLEAADVGDDVLEARYLTDPEYELTVRHVLFFSERWRPPTHRDEARAKAERSLNQLEAGADFPETAARLSEEPGAEGREGLLQPGREGAWVDEFWAAASALEVGEISPVTETQYGFHILRLEGREVVPFVEARSAVARPVADQVGDPTAYLQAWEDPEARSEALEAARVAGVSVPEAEQEEIRRRWTDLTTRWATALGFRSGMTPEEVRAAALDAMARTAQGAAIAREGLAARAELLRAAYPVDTGPAS